MTGPYGNRFGIALVIVAILAGYFAGQRMGWWP